jgi:hypothetical protein
MTPTATVRPATPSQCPVFSCLDFIGSRVRGADLGFLLSQVKMAPDSRVTDNLLRAPLVFDRFGNYMYLSNDEDLNLERLSLSVDNNGKNLDYRWNGLRQTSDSIKGGQ